MPKTIKLGIWSWVIAGFFSLVGGVPGGFVNFLGWTANVSFVLAVMCLMLGIIENFFE